MRTAYLVTKPWLGTIDADDLEFGLTMLGKFLGQLAAAPEKPSAVCFYTEGVKAALEDSPFVDTLQQLADAGVPLLLCGTCVDHYGLEGQLSVGEIADMQAIAGALATADKVVTV